jgi:hypothetical protein
LQPPAADTLPATDFVIVFLSTRVVTTAKFWFVKWISDWMRLDENEFQKFKHRCTFLN